MGAVETHHTEGFSLHVGDVFDGLGVIPDESIDCVVTSPPYYAMRDYGVEGQIGLEETLGEYIDTLVSVFRGLRRVLAPHGTAWLNLGDSYAADHPQSRTGSERGPWAKIGGADSAREGRARPEGVKAKDLIGVPWEVAFALRNDGWHLRSAITW